MSDIVQKLWGFCRTRRHDGVDYGQYIQPFSEHLVKNLSMDEEESDLMPLLALRGGKAKARKVFAELQQAVAKLNEVIAA
jgi:hypothetical protein